MRTAILILCLVAGGASAADIVIYPDSANFAWRMRTDGDVPVHEVGLVDCELTDPAAADVVARIPIPVPSAGLIVEGGITLDIEGGNVCFKGVGFSSLGVMSPLSADTFQIRMVPDAPILLPGAGDVVIDAGGAADAGGAEEG